MDNNTNFKTFIDNKDNFYRLDLKNDDDYTYNNQLIRKFRESSNKQLLWCDETMEGSRDKIRLVDRLVKDYFKLNRVARVDIYDQLNINEFDYKCIDNDLGIKPDFKNLLWDAFNEKLDMLELETYFKYFNESKNVKYFYETTSDMNGEDLIYYSSLRGSLKNIDIDKIRNMPYYDLQKCSNGSYVHFGWIETGLNIYDYETYSHKIWRKYGFKEINSN